MNNSRISLFFLTLLVVITTSCIEMSKKVGVAKFEANSLTKANPEEQGMSTERLEQISEMMQKQIDKGKLPGAVALVARNGKVVYHEAFGLANAETGRKFQKNDIFRIASQTKAITATAVMILWEEGHFDLDQPISDFIPEFKDPQVLVSFNEEDSSFTSEPAGREITIRHLLTHTSGLGYGRIDNQQFRKMYVKAGVTDLFTTEPVTIEQSVKILATLPLHSKPGERFIYSEGLDVLGYLVEIVSGMKFNEFLRTRLFDPLGMKDTWFYLPEEISDRLVPVQTKVDGEWKNYPITFYDPDYPKKGAKTFYSGGAGLSSTAMDYARFLQMYHNGGTFNDTRILSPTTVRTIMHNQIDTLWRKNVSDYGLAFGVLKQKGEISGGKGSIGTFDWGGYFNTQYFADPELGITGILMKQTQGVGEPTGKLFRRMVFAAVEEME